MVKRNNRFMLGDQPPTKKAKPRAKAKPFVMGDTGVTVRKRKPTPVAPVTRAMKTAAVRPKAKPKVGRRTQAEISRAKAKIKVKRANSAESTPQFTRAQFDKASMKAWRVMMNAARKTTRKK